MRGGSPNLRLSLRPAQSRPELASSACSPRPFRRYRRRSAVLSRQATQGVLPLLPLPPHAPNKLARDIESAAKADCRTAHTGLGILAVVPLAVDALRTDGCRW